MKVVSCCLTVKTPPFHSPKVGFSLATDFLVAGKKCQESSISSNLTIPSLCAPQMAPCDCRNVVLQESLTLQSDVCEGKR